MCCLYSLNNYIPLYFHEEIPIHYVPTPPIETLAIIVLKQVSIREKIFEWKGNKELEIYDRNEVLPRCQNIQLCLGQNSALLPLHCPLEV